MPARYKVWSEIGLVYVQYEPIITTDDVLDALAEYMRSPEWNPAFHHLVDMSQATRIDIDFNHMLRVVGQISDKNGQRAKDAKTAIYAPDDVQFGVARMYQSLGEDRVGFAIGVFRTRNEALAFLDMRTETVAPHWDAAMSEG